MTEQDNKAKALQFVQLMGRAEAEAAFRLMAEDAVWWTPTDAPGGADIPLDRMKGAIGGFFGVFATLPVFEVQGVLAEGDCVCIRQTSRGGITRGGAPYGNDYLMLLRFRDGLIVEVREYMNPILAAPLMQEMQSGNQAHPAAARMT